MLTFSDDFLMPQQGTIRYWHADPNDPQAETWSVAVPLATFSAADIYDPLTFQLGSEGPEIIDTAVRLDFIELRGSTLQGLDQQTFTFPVNPEDGFIDASVYIGGGHCPVEVTRIEFGPVSGDLVTATLHAYFDFNAEAVEIENRAAVLTTELRLTG
ncbi:hypothetical protein OG225_07005 [Nocardia sp. NBC_01377]|uniref:hypothetical protein n=1 Tax=Nocardia sp. NBC_01377 TaxID=2903595 RepID=UPI00324804FE